MAKVEVFDGDDAAYQEWLANNPQGYVVNVRRNLTPSYMVLHKSNCDFICNQKRMAQKGGFTERAYLKICSNEINDLREWIRRHGRNDGGFSKECSKCN